MGILALIVSAFVLKHYGAVNTAVVSVYVRKQNNGCDNNLRDMSHVTRDNGDRPKPLNAKEIRLLLSPPVM